MAFRPAATDDDFGVGPIAGDEDPRLLPYRNWALQNNPIAALGADAAWTGAAPGSGAAAGDVADGGEAGVERGQGPLLKELEPDPKFKTRTIVSLGLWVVAIGTSALNQTGSFGPATSRREYLISIAWAIAGMSLTAAVYPRLWSRPRAFVVAEQLLVGSAIPLIAYKCGTTDGAESPFAVWWLYGISYAAQFMPRRQAVANIAAICVVSMAPIVYDGTVASGESPVVMFMLLAVNLLMAWTLISGREIGRKAERAVRYLALADPLTGVANRRYFESFAASVIADKRGEFALVMADMNGLKGANLAFGAAVGDDMLRRLAAVMCRVSDADCQVARIHGDEFAVLLPGAGEAAADDWRARFDAAIEAHNDWAQGRRPRLSATVGTAVHPRDGRTIADLIDVADRRMYERKSLVPAPPYVVSDVAEPIGAENILRASDAAAEALKPEHPARLSKHAAPRWLAASVALLLWSAIPGLWNSHRVGTAALGAATLIVATLVYLLRRSRFAVNALAISDVAAMTVVAPMIWLTGGWRSPIQLATFFPLAFYAQHMRGRRAIARVASVIGLYGVAFWTSHAVGATGAPVTGTGRSLFVTIITAQVAIAAILRYNRRVADAATREILDTSVRDPLTDMCNLYAFRRDLAVAIDAASSDVTLAARPALAFVDVDRLHIVNDIAGHAAGDRVLREFGVQLRAAIADRGWAYRIGSDEFAVLHEAESEADAADFAERIHETLVYRASPEFDLPAVVTVSVGHAVWRPGMTAEAFAAVAERSLSQHKPALAAEPGSVEGETLL